MNKKWKNKKNDEIKEIVFDDSKKQSHVVMLKEWVMKEYQKQHNYKIN